MKSGDNITGMNWVHVDKAVDAIKDGFQLNCKVNESIKVYKVPSNNPNKYTIRIDIKVED